MLTKEQKKLIDENKDKLDSLQAFVDLVYGENPKVDPRSREGREVRSYLTKQGINYQTSRTRMKEIDKIEFSEAQKQFIITEARRGLSSFRIAEQLFPEREVKNLGVEQRAVVEFLKTLDDSALEGRFSDYRAPQSVGRAVYKVNVATGLQLDENRLERNHKVCIDKLIVNMNNSRFLTIINNYKRQPYRELFEQEFIRNTWDKPDLSAEEVNQYMTLCKDIVYTEEAAKHIQKLNEMFEDVEDQTEMGVKLSEAIKAKSDELHKVEQRIAKTMDALNGSRSKRLEKLGKQTANFLSIVEAFQDEEGRQQMLRLAEMRNKQIRDGLDRLDSMEEWKARILGISKLDVVPE